MADVKFLNGRQAITDELNMLIERQPQDAPVLLVVAYWGRGAEALLREGKSYKVVCNLTDGGTNPAVIESLMVSRECNIELRHHPRLHAKVVVSQSGTIVSSANFSTNGLCINDEEGNLEAGTFIPEGSDAYCSVRNWAWEIWLDAAEVDSAVLRAAKAAYASHQNVSQSEDSLQDNKPLLPSAGASLPQLDENEIFSHAAPNQKYPLKRGSSALLASYRAMVCRSGDGKEGLICAYAANLMWTHIGNSMSWHNGIFVLPRQVVNRWRDVNTIKDDEVAAFLSWLAKPGNASPSIGEVADDLLETGWNDYVNG
ncbi:phospholipase D family protein [Marinobacterium lutimaris]|uniref:Phospholipase D-like domain-containing protein n=1 Tax=Marinobacterium lutimaris TaxID=568106 RepID=A0A1H5VTH7_9GAMM|nr:phospholipase D family protein [Marinobacterium lutimaris]SEF89837.1 hypothetical protein SAMN05444390_101817 [Marinobacterium lutimaris]